MFKSSLKYKMLHLVIVQAVFLGVVLLGISLINPNWVLWSTSQNAQHTDIIKAFKHEYGMLNTLSMELAGFREQEKNQKPTIKENISLNKDYGIIQQSLLKHINTVKALSKKGQKSFAVDFSVLVSFLFHYQDQINKLNPMSPGFEERLWLNQLYFSRIQSEFFYIIEEVDRVEANRIFTALQFAQTSLLIWGVASLMLMAISTFIALSYARKWKAKIATLLNLSYRASMRTNNTHPVEIPESNDELDYLAEVLHSVLGDTAASKNNTPQNHPN